MGDVHHVEQQVRLPHLVQRRLEGVHQVGGQFADEAHGVGQEERQVVDDNLAHGGVQRGKELVLGEDLALGQEVHQRALAHVGVSHQGHAYQAAAVLALRGLLLVYLLQPLLQQADTLQDDAAVHFQLRLAGASQSHGAFAPARAGAASLPLQVGP